jgi:orotate phosphoribosyltransferase-like protein
VDEDLAVFKPNRGYLVMYILLTETGCAIFAFSTVNERRCFVVETVESLRRLIHECIILRNKLPTHFGWVDIIMRRIVVGRNGIRHDGWRK